ncbi:hypothetical protein [Nitrospira lenta]|uniref:Uncharacterized protein n=1 Tax=Nitrospira lenta TaxID=1436998 RepID=A0A330L811_9BACT|nr:hypothetical protein [Nitrospira lenta]SPP63076.1 hypothetical protein NITLEN_10162 [Nitrospira lenta]
MEFERECAEYREHLLSRVKAGSGRSVRGVSDPIHVFVNQRRAGVLDGAGAKATVQIQSQTCIESVHLRSEDGVLLGGLSAPEYGYIRRRIDLTGDVVELCVHNTTEGGSVSAVFLPAPGLWRRAWDGMFNHAAPHPVVAGAGPWMRSLIVAQVVLAVGLFGLVADRFTGWLSPVRMPLSVTQVEAPWAAPLADVAKLEQQLVELSRMQAKAMEAILAQQQGMAQIQRTVAKVSSTQETVASSVLTVKQEMEQRKNGTGRDADRLTRVLMSKALSEQEQLEAELHSLVIANERLVRERAQLEQHNQELNRRLKTGGTDVSKAVAPDREKPMTALQSAPSHPPQVADAKAVPPYPPFLFWVTFSEGVTQDSIDQWVRDMHGRKGAVSEGWQAVEIVPPAEPVERFLDRLKQTQIVKAVRISR